MEIEKLEGTAPRLYQLVAPLVMSIPVLRQNNNYPFKTSERHVWFVALEDNVVNGFLPVEFKNSYIYIDNYYIRGEDTELLSTLIRQVITEFAGKKPLYALSHIAHAEIFQNCGFSTKKEWKLYVKMIYDEHENE